MQGLMRSGGTRMGGGVGGEGEGGEGYAEIAHTSQGGLCVYHDVPGLNNMAL